MKLWDKDSLDMPRAMDKVKGFFTSQEGRALYHAALKESRRGPCLELGSYCGKSTVYYAKACQHTNSVLFAVDHHRGSEENQPGQQYHDPTLYDAARGRMNSFPTFQDTLRLAKVEDVVVPVVAPSALVARAWQTPLAMIFLDAGHSEKAAFEDYHGWRGHLMPHGLLAIHDVYPNPEDGGRPPFMVYTTALQNGFTEEKELAVKSLRFLRKA